VARIVALARMFNFDHARAEIGEHHRAIRSREDAREIDDNKS